MTLSAPAVPLHSTRVSPRTPRGFSPHWGSGGGWKSAISTAPALSRPQQRQRQEQTVLTHDDHYQFSLLIDETAYDFGELSQATIEIEVVNPVGVEDAHTVYEHWLASDVTAAFNEPVVTPTPP